MPFARTFAHGVLSRNPHRAALTAALVTVLSTAIALLGLALPLTVQAAENQAITVSDLRLVKSSSTGQDDPGDTSITVDDVLRLSFAWNARNANAKDGDSFSIGLPEELRNRESPLSQPLTVTYNGTQTTIGTCVLDQRSITCTFNSELDALVAQGFSGLSGTGSALVVAEQATESSTVDVNANGRVTPVEIPGGRIAEYTGDPYSPESLRKWAFPLTSTSDAVDWELNFGTPAITEALAAGGNPITVDGRTVSTITLTDRLTPGQVYNTDLSTWTLDIGKSAGNDTEVGTVTDAAGTDHNTDLGNFDLEVTLDGNQATIRVTGPFAPNTNYVVYYSSTPTTDDQVVQAGVEYGNSAVLTGTTLEDAYTVYYARSFTIDVTMEAGFGGLNITKLLSGEAAPRVPEGTTFTVDIAYTLPGGATVDTYEGWTAPGEVNAQRTGGSTTMEVTLGAITTYNGTFPAGTVLTLSEDPTSASTTPDGATWGTPEFTVGSETTTSLTVADQESTAVTLRNTAEESPASTGSFSVAKTVEGAEDLTSKEFTFTYTCNDAGSASGTLTATGDGTPADAGVSLPAGTECTITEDTEAAQEDGYALAAPAPQTITISDDTDQTVTAAFTNTYTPEESPTPTPSPSETPSAPPSPSETPSTPPTPSETPSASPSPSETPSASPSPSETSTPGPTGTSPTATATESSTPGPEATSTDGPGTTPTPSATGSETPGAPGPDPTGGSSDAPTGGEGGDPTPGQPSAGTPLARTGASTGIALVALVGLVAGSVLLVARRRD